MTDNSNKKSFWQKYKYILLLTLIVPVALVIIRALRPDKKQDTNLSSQADTNKNILDTSSKTDANQAKITDKQNNTPQDSLENNSKKEVVATKDKVDQSKHATTQNTPRKLTSSNPYIAYYKKQAAKNKAIPSNVHFYYPPNNKNVHAKKGRILTAPSPVKPKKVKKTYKIEVLPEPAAQILSDQVTIYSDIELGKTLLDRKVTKDADGLVKKIYKTQKGKVGEVEMELWILARHWQRQNGRMINKVYCTNDEGKLDLHNLADGRLYLEPLLSEKKALFGSLQQIPQNNKIEILDTEKKKFKAYNDNYNQYTWFKIKVKGYIKWSGVPSTKKESKD
ncbi:hypothetical protein [Microscilla marina]|uniref:Uncharacterized protein n=1 Tax=Microscilla marina ATCC 23134 TaxID=313606 RepID=A1ZGX7_MICM2|nr:hypothetical protein [Microscilla marina]EAY30246.1 hypothetical protein M23134_08070 [Microscilla marina ATCC 23134]